MEMRASQVIKGALGGGVKKRLREKHREKERRGEIPLNPRWWKGAETGMSHLFLFSDSSSEASFELTCLDSKVIVTFVGKLSSRNHYDSFKVEKKSLVAH